MKKIIVLFLVLIFSSCQNKINKTEQIIFARIEYIFNLKPLIRKQIWSDFDNKKYDLPLIYYTESSSYITNPTKKFISIFKPKLVFKNKKIKIYKTLKRFDKNPLHMETAISGDSKDEYNYHSPFMNCSSYEVVSKNIPDTKSTEYWVTMIIHEYFHGFQFKHKSYLVSNFTFLSSIPGDSLTKIYEENVWFQKKIKEENDFLLQAIQSTNKSEITKNINSFFKTRKERRVEFKRRLNFNIDEYEKRLETMEGTARYVEYKLQIEFATLKLDQKLMNIDTSYHSYKVFKNYKIENDPWLFKIGKSYFYSTGFNMIRLFDKLKIKYKNRLFNEGNLTLEQLLYTSKQKK